MKKVLHVLRHRAVVRTARVLRAIVVTCAVILAVAIVTTVTIDLGPYVRQMAETRGSEALGRPLEIGRLSIRLWNGRFQVEDLVIGGPTPESPPFLTAQRVSVAMPWETLFDRRVVFETIDLQGWRMHVEQFADGHTFPGLERDEPQAPRGESQWTTTLRRVRASDGQFTYEDHATPWMVVARNIDVTLVRRNEEYRGEARFTGGTVDLLEYEPFGVDMDATFLVDGSRLVFDRIDLLTDGARTRVNGDVNLAFWPEQMFEVRSTIDLPRMREIFFANDEFSLSGTGEFHGSFHLFRETLANGEMRTGRELKGTFESPLTGVDDYRFRDVRGQVRWVPETLVVHDATASVYGGTARFSYRMGPFGAEVPAVATFDATYASVDLPTVMRLFDVEGVQFRGRLSGRNRVAWPLGGFADREFTGDVRVQPPAGTSVLTREIPLDLVERQEARHLAEPFDPRPSIGPVPLAGEVRYRIGPRWIEIGPSRVATPETYVEFEGRTAYGEQSHFPFHVTSADWQESDRLLAGLLTAFGAPTSAIPVGGYGTFDGEMRESFRAPVIEGRFAGERMRAFDVLWGAAEGSVVIADAYVDAEDVVVTHEGATIDVDGRFSLGFPRADGGEEINARVRLDGRPVADLRQAFGLEDYDVDGTFSGEFHVYGGYTTPYGFGTMRIDRGTAYGEPFEEATADVRMEGTGIQLVDVRLDKGGGHGTGAAYVGLNGTYSFTFDGRDIPVESLALAEGAAMPLSGLLDFTAGGSGTFDEPRYDVRATIRDFFVADEGIGQVVGTLSIDRDLLTLRFEAASPRLAISGAGRILLTGGMESDLSFTVADTSLDPYVRAYEPRLSPFTTAVASGSVRVVGELASLDNLLVDVTVDRLDLRLFDYRIENAAPIRVALDHQELRIADMRLEGEDTQLEIGGAVALDDERILLRVTGDANLAVLQGFLGEVVRSSGRATLSATIDGPLRDPLVNGTLLIDNGRIRHFDLPHALEALSGPVQFDARGVSMDGLSGRIGGGTVQFGGRIDKDGYLPGRIDVTMQGRGMRVRYPQGMSSLIDADLALQGTTELSTLSGLVTVRDAVYRQPFETTLFDTAAGPVPAPPADAEPGLPLRYDVRIFAPSTVHVRNAARLDLSADLQLSGTWDRPLLFGRAEIDRGEFTFEGRRYLVTRGTVDFNNPTRIEPFFDVETETRVRVPGDTYRVNVRAAGTPETTALEFTSDPPLPEVEVLALLLGDFVPGRDVEFLQYSAEITPQQQLLREQATRQLTRGLSSEVGRVVEQTFGVDSFQFTPSLVDPQTQSSRLDPAARLTIGKRLSDRAYLTYSRTVSSSTSDQIFLLEYDQSDRLSWILSRNEDRTYAVEFRLRRTF